jgi:hypothetical protein
MRFVEQLITSDICLQRSTRIKALNYYSQKYLYLNSVLVYQRARGKGQDFGARILLPKALTAAIATETSIVMREHDHNQILTVLDIPPYKKER